MMNKYIQKFRESITKLDEAKQVGLLYHATELEDVIYILQTNKLNASRDIGISVSRSKTFFLNNGIYSRGGYDPWNACLVLDGDKLSNNYKILPFQYPTEKDSFETLIITNKDLDDEKYDYPISSIDKYYNWIKKIETEDDEDYAEGEPGFICKGSTLYNLNKYLVKILVDKNAIELTEHSKLKYGEKANDIIKQNKNYLEKIKNLTNVKIEFVNKRNK